ncbi:putative manganese transporter [uncultured Anaerofustis sp.]|uniref:putative manganese transporter n=1 Tax=uncultured Anaerofustis sp. TaxID=904996 RepID=UPI0025D250D3|nr:putative manganese transporter [uncultured Anaerofustis sp.]
MFWDSFVDAFMDSIKIFPFLLITYIVLEYIEHKTSDKLVHIIEHAGILGPILGGIFGIVPQCGFSTAAANFYAGRIVTLGTLISIFLSTSDEMLPIMISNNAPISMILKVLLLKMFIGIIFGIVLDLIFRKRSLNGKMHMGETDNHMHDDCSESESFIMSAIKHTLNIFVFIFIISFVLNIIIAFIGEDNLSNFIFNTPIIGSLLAGLVGLIPNCAASVVITDLYLKGAICFGAMMSGLLSSAGVGLLVLFKVNKDKLENIKIVSILYFISIFCGIALEILGFGI